MGRQGDSAPLSLVELVTYAAPEEKKKSTIKKAKEVLEKVAPKKKGKEEKKAKKEEKEAPKEKKEKPKKKSEEKKQIINRRSFVTQEGLQFLQSLFYGHVKSRMTIFL
jgi:hypothetical protein